jgi:hypothetical protein
VHAPSDRKQLFAGAGRLRALQRFGNDHHRRRNDWPLLFAIELDPAYVDVAVLRWQAFTGGTATLEDTGRPFAEVAAERQAEGIV